jgi:SAM-dependent methyltransferase
VTSEQIFLDELVDSFVARYENEPTFRRGLSLFLFEAREVRERLGGSGPLRCLDLGCGPGIVSAAVADLGFDVVGVDASERMIGAARHLSCRRPNGHGRTEFVRADLLDYVSAAAPGSFAFVISSDVLQYRADPIRIAERVATCLASGGTFALSIPNRNSVLRIAEPWVQGILPAKARNRKFWANELAQKDYLAALVDFDLTLERMKTFGLPSVLAPVADTVLANRRLETMTLLVFRRL